MIQDCEDVAEYIEKNYPKARAGARKIVEAGIGSETCVFEKLKEKNFNVTAFDLKPKTRKTIKSNVFSPEAIEIFKEAELIYAIRPNPELTEALKNIAKDVNADLLIRPFSSDEKPEDMTLVNYKRARVWIKTKQIK